MLNDLSPILVTGGAGFIGSNFVLDWLALVGSPLVNLDKLTYAGNLQNLTSVAQHPAYSFEQGDICDQPFIDRLFDRYQPRALLHFAAESHVDRSLAGPEAFVRTNVDGTFRLLEASRAYLAKLDARRIARSFVFCTSRPTRFMAHFVPRTHPSRRPPRTPQTVPMPPPRQAQTIWCAPMFIAMGCLR